MNRTDLIGIELEATRRRITAPFELRKDSTNGGGLTFKGYASTTETAYPVFGGTYPGWMETVANGAFKRTLRNKADVAFLINHDGMTLARTKSGTMSLREDDTGLAVTANLDPRMNAVNDLYVASQRGDIDEMSFAFRVERDEWFDENGDPSTSAEGVNRRITEINLNKGDVSAVNYGANDTTSGGFRDIEMALAELRDGRELSDKQRDLIRTLARTVGEQPELRADMAQMQVMDQHLVAMENAVALMREHMNSMMDAEDIGADGTPGSTFNGVKLGPGIETLAALRALHEARRDNPAA